VQPVGQLVEVGEAGRHPDHLAAAGADGLDLVERALHDRRQREVVLRRPLVGDAVDLGLGRVDDVVGVAVARVAELHDLGAGLDQAAQDRGLAHDARVVAGVGRRRHRLQEGVEVRRAAHPAHLAALDQLGRHGDRVGRLAAAVEVEDRLVDQLVRRPVEVWPAQHLDDVGDRVLGQQHAAQHGLLGGEVLRRGADERPGTPGVRQLDDAHARRRVHQGVDTTSALIRNSTAYPRHKPLDARAGPFHGRGAGTTWNSDLTLGPVHAPVNARAHALWTGQWTYVLVLGTACG
jgi:hypothetical protein